MAASENKMVLNSIIFSRPFQKISMRLNRGTSLVLSFYYGMSYDEFIVSAA